MKRIMHGRIIDTIAWADVILNRSVSYDSAIEAELIRRRVRYFFETPGKERWGGFSIIKVSFEFCSAQHPADIIVVGDICF